MEPPPTIGKTTSRKTRTAVSKYGKDKCLEAYRLHRHDGEGASTVGIYLGLTTNQADAAINAGRELITGEKS